MKLLIYATQNPRYNIKSEHRPPIDDGVSAPAIVFFHPISAANDKDPLTKWILIGEYIGGNNAVNPNLIPVFQYKSKYKFVLEEQGVYVETPSTDEKTDEKDERSISLEEAFRKVNATLDGEDAIKSGEDTIKKVKIKKETIIIFLLAFNAAGYNSLTYADLIYNCLIEKLGIELSNEFRDSIISDMMLRGVSYEFLWASLGAKLK